MYVMCYLRVHCLQVIAFVSLGVSPQQLDNFSTLVCEMIPLPHIHHDLPSRCIEIFHAGFLDTVPECANNSLVRKSKRIPHGNLFPSEDTESSKYARLSADEKSFCRATVEVSPCN